MDRIKKYIYIYTHTMHKIMNCIILKRSRHNVVCLEKYYYAYRYRWNIISRVLKYAKYSSHAKVIRNVRGKLFQSQINHDDT